MRAFARNFGRWAANALVYAFMLVVVPVLLVAATVVGLGQGGVLHGAHGVVVGRTRSSGSGRNAVPSYRLHVRTSDGVSEVSVTSGAYLECPDGARLDIDAFALTFRCGGERYTHLALCCPFVSVLLTAGWIWLMIAMLRARRARSAAQ